MNQHDNADTLQYPFFHFFDRRSHAAPPTRCSPWGRRAQQSCHLRGFDRHVMRLPRIHRCRHREHSENYFLMYAGAHCSEHSPPAAGRPLRQPRHAASRRLDIFYLGARQRSCVATLRPSHIDSSPASPSADLQCSLCLTSRSSHWRIDAERSSDCSNAQFVTGILLADGSDFFSLRFRRRGDLGVFSGIFTGGERARSRRRRHDTHDFESADRRRLSDDRRAFESRSIRILARQCRCNSSPHFSLCRRREALRLNA